MGDDVEVMSDVSDENLNKAVDNFKAINNQPAIRIV